MTSKPAQNSVSWRLRESEATAREISGMARDLEISPVFCRILHNRGITTSEDMHFFLSPGLRYLKPLEEWEGLIDAALILAQSISRKERIAVWGDYDVDGITAVALIKD